MKWLSETTSEVSTRKGQEQRTIEEPTEEQEARTSLPRLSSMSATLSFMASTRGQSAAESRQQEFSPPTPQLQVEPYAADDDEVEAEHDMSPHVVGVLGFSMYGVLCFVVL